MPSKTFFNALKVSLIYALFGGAWILGSDRLLAALIHDVERLNQVQTVKGWLFVLVTAALLFWLLSRRYSLRTREQALAQQQLSDALWRSEQRYKLLFKRSPIPMWVYDLENYQFLAVNDMMLKTYGYSREELLGMTIFDIRPDDERERLKNTLAKASGEIRAMGLWRHRRRDGSELMVEIHAQGFEYEGRPARLVVAQDVTERAHTQDALRGSEQRWQRAIDAISDGLWEWNVIQGTVFYSRRAKEMLGYRDGEFENFEHWSSALHPDDKARVLKENADHVAGRISQYECDYRLRHKDGSYRWIRARGRAVERDENGIAILIVGSHTDITDRHAAEEHQRLAAQVFEHSHDAILILDRELRTVSVNPRFTELSGYRPEELIGQSPIRLAIQDQPEAFFDAIREQVRQTGFWNGEVVNRTKTGDELILHEAISAVRDGDGSPRYYIIVASDITERKQSQQRIQFLAQFDALTALPNRALLHDRLSQAITRAEQESRLVGVLALDIDRFKNVNDSLGHRIGDLLLIDIARRLEQTLREGDTIARLGADAFALVLPALKVPENAARVAEKVHNALQHPFDIQGHLLTVSASIGISLYPNDGTQADILLRNADAAMYHAKDQGRANFQYYTADLNAQALEALAIENALRTAIAESQLVLHYQPQFSLRGHRLVGAEALVRWPHPERGMLSPALFIPLAEERGLIGLLGEWTLRCACRQLRQWLNDGLEAVPVAVNLSALQFRDRQLADKIAAILREADVPPELLHLEITESALIQDLETTLNTLRQLTELGCQLAIDDFGTGYSSLSYLRRFPIHKLKIDRSFINELSSSSDAAAITETVITMAKSLRLKVIAEGVETEAQRRLLADLGCDELQGFLLGRPMPVEQFTEKLKER